MMIVYHVDGGQFPTQARTWELALTLWFMGQVPFRTVERIECGDVVAEIGDPLPSDIITASIAAVERKWCSVPENIEEQAEALVRYLHELRDIALVDDEPEPWGMA